MKKAAAILVFLLCVLNSTAQTDSTRFIPQYRKGHIYLAKTTNGSTYMGVLTNETKDFVTLENRKQQQTYELRKSELVSMRMLPENKVQEELFGINYHAHTYMFSASSVVYEKPKVSLNYQWFLFENLNYAINDNWELTMNTILLYPSSVGVKCAYKIGSDTYLGANAFVVGNLSSRISNYFFLGYGALARFTKGNTNNNFSFSGGVLGINSELVQSNSKVPVLNLPFVSFAYANRFSERWGVCAEAFYFPEAQTGFAGGGFKFMKNTETAWTFGCFTYLSMVNNQLAFNRKAIPIPFISYTSNIF